MHELILGGQRSGKSRCAESRAAAWLARDAQHGALLLATALGADDEMRARIERHRADRAIRLPALACVEAPFALAEALRRHASQPLRLVVVDCLTLWLANLLMPAAGVPLDETAWHRERDALRAAAAPVVLVSNEIGLGIAPLGAPARRYVDELGRLHQSVAAECASVTLMVARLEVAVKR